MASTKQDRKPELHPLALCLWVIEELHKNLQMVFLMARTLPFREQLLLPCTPTICHPSTAMEWRSITTTIPPLFPLYISGNHPLDDLLLR